MLYTFPYKLCVKTEGWLSNKGVGVYYYYYHHIQVFVNRIMQLNTEFVILYHKVFYLCCTSQNLTAN